jgi:hypothetical protein
MLLWTAAVNAEQTQQYIPLDCYPMEPFLKNFKEFFEEELVFMSGSVNELNEQLYHQMWMNPESQTWTFMVSNKKREMICIIASGRGFADLSKVGI